MPAADPFALHWSLYPRQYIAPRATKPLVIDGNINKPEWDALSFSAPFDEIRGSEDAPPGSRPPETCKTRMKMMWDDEYLYVCALIESDFSVIANFTKRNEPIFQKDSDFEVFLNPSGSCHDYKELELNAINTVWNLMLDKPYGDGGVEHSGRIHKPGEKDFYEVYDQMTAAKVVKGKIGDPKGATWVVELALAHSDILAKDPYGEKPAVGGRWRINFSRVEHQGDINWTWQPQRIWDPQLHRVAGKVDMHLPDAWGYVEFAPADASVVGDVPAEEFDPERRDPAWPARLTAINVYYAQRKYWELNSHQKYASDLSALKSLLDPEIVKPFLDSTGDADRISITLSDGGKCYQASVVAPGNIKATINEQRLLLVEQIGGGIDAPVLSSN